MQKRTLTVTFERSVTAGFPNTVEVAVKPMATSTTPPLGSVLDLGPQSRDIQQDNEPTTVTFSPVPSNPAEIDETIPYRIAWRERYAGHQYTADFLMPDADTNFAELAGQGNILMVR